MKYAIAFLGLLGAALAGCNTAHGGGTLPSADSSSSNKSTFGFSYRCDESTQKVTGVFNYQDHGVGIRFTGKINEQLNPSLSGVSCGDQWNGIGIAGACGVVTKGAGGVAAGDLIVVATGDGDVVDTTTADIVAVALFHPAVSLDPNAPLNDYDCAAVVSGAFGTPYYANEGELSAGNVISSQ